MDDWTEDAKTFGADRWVYCAQHLRSHITGWCTVSVDQKTLLDARSNEDAATECVRRGFKIFNASAHADSLPLQASTPNASQVVSIEAAPLSEGGE